MITYQKMTISLLIVLAAAGFFAGHLWPAEKKLPWQENWDKTVAAAKNEGQLTVYGSRGYEIHFRDFQKKYPDIKVTTVLGRGAEIGAKLMSERRAGKYLADIYAGGTNTLYLVLYQNKALDPIRTVLLLPEVLDESKWWRGKHHYNDTEGQFIFIFEGSVQTGRIGYNTQLVDPNQVKSYWDLLNPKWKGKIVSNDPGRGGESTQSLRFFYHNPELGPDFIWRLFTEMDVTISRDSRQIVDWLGTGKFSLSLFTGVYQGTHHGLPVDEFNASTFREGGFVDPYVGAVGLLKQAPHPNASKVAINWLLSREGQIAFQSTLADIGNYRESMREDISKEIIPLTDRRTKEHKYLFTSRADWMDMTPVLNHVTKALQEAKKK
jgi:iron(III) transport system substrate-binding protein